MDERMDEHTDEHTDERSHPAHRALLRARALLSRLRALPHSAAGRKTIAVSGVGLAVLLALALAGIPGIRRNNAGASLESTGKELFEAIMDQNPSLRLSSRVADATERGSASNLLVLPDVIWDKLAVAQRNSLGAWLNTLGRTWNIEVGTLSEDGSRVLSPKPVITSLEWNRQVK